MNSEFAMEFESESKSSNTGGKVMNVTTTNKPWKIENSSSEKSSSLKKGSSSKKTSFMDLPCEIRCDIYQLLIQRGKPTLVLAAANGSRQAIQATLPDQKPNLAWFWKKRYRGSILRVCRQIRLEALGELHKNTRFIWPKDLYKPEIIKTVLSPLSSCLRYEIRHIKLFLVVDPTALYSNEEATMFNDCCVQWAQSLRGLKTVDVHIDFDSPKHNLLLTEERIRVAAAFINKALRPFRNVDQILLSDPHFEKRKDTGRVGRKRRFEDSRANLSGNIDPESRMRVLHIAMEAMRINRLMSINRNWLETAMNPTRCRTTLRKPHRTASSSTPQHLASFGLPWHILYS